MRSMKGRAKEFWVCHPLLDLFFVVIVVLLASFLLPHEINDSGRDTVSEFFIGLSALGGVAFAAETFACTMTYSSSNEFIQRVRTRYAALLRDTWTMVLGGTFFSAIGAIFALFAVDTQWRPALVGTLGAAALVITGFTRSLYWLRYTLFTDHLVGKVAVEDLPSGIPSAPRGKL